MTAKRQLISAAAKESIYGCHLSPPVIDSALCKGCGDCDRVCPSRVFQREGKKSSVVFGEACIACGHCVAVCPERAVTQAESSTSTEIAMAEGPAVSAETLQLLLRERRSVRIYEKGALPREQVEKIVEAARYAPAGSNRRNAEWVVLANPEKVAELRELVLRFMRKTFKRIDNWFIGWLYALKYGRANLNLLRNYSEHLRNLDSLKHTDKLAYYPLPYGSAVMLTHAVSNDVVGPFNGAVAIYNGSLAAHAMGLGSCFLGFVQIAVNMDKRVRHFLGIPKNHSCNGAMVVGRPKVKYRRVVERPAPAVRWH